MAIRNFVDSAGLAWRVWPTMPQVGAIYDERLRSGWLTFENAAGERKRLAPIPGGWDEQPAERLDLMCRAAEAVRRTGATPDPEGLDPALGSSEAPPAER